MTPNLSKLFPCLVFLLIGSCSAQPVREPERVEKEITRSLVTGDVAVHVGGDENLDACSSQAVPRLSAAADPGYIEVRKGPGEEFSVVDRLETERIIIVCSEDGLWSGVVYPERGTDSRDCGVSSPIDKLQPYKGPCKSGWIRRDALEIVAG
ncbi:MAG: integron [Thermoanaerobaculia bacterium]